MASNPAAEDTHYRGRQATRTLMNAVWGGTETMVAAGQTFLPKETAEDPDEYESRLKRSVFFAATRKTAEDLADKVFSQPIKITDGSADPKIVEWSENIDMAGTALNNFAREVFLLGIKDGISYVLVDMPPALEPGATLADQIALNHRPYFVKIAEEDIISITTKTVANRQVISQVRFKEIVEELKPDDEFEKVSVDQRRVIDMVDGVVRWRVFREADGKDGKKEWVLHDQGVTKPVTEIPLVPFYAKRTGFMRGEPVLKNLAELNIAHWQSASDQRNILHVARVPILFASGFNEDDKLVVSASHFTKTSNDKANLKWVEHSGAAIEAGSKDIKDIEQRMQVYGLELVLPKGSNNSATGDIIDADRMATPLGIMSDNLADCLEQCLIFAAQFAGIDKAKAGEVQVHKDFAFNIASVDLDVLLKAVAVNIISKETWRAEAQRRGALSSNVTTEGEEQAMADEADDAGIFGVDPKAKVDPKPKADPEVNQETDPED